MTPAPCPQCGRRLSERRRSHIAYLAGEDNSGIEYCKDPCHDTADHAVELAEALRRVRASITLNVYDGYAWAAETKTLIDDVLRAAGRIQRAD